MKGKSLISLALSTLILVGCGTGTSSSNTSSTQNSTSSTTPTSENEVKIKNISVNENQTHNLKSRARKNAKDSTEDFNYTIITRPQEEVQFTITLDNPKAFGINALEIACDDENAEIMIEGEYKKISDYSIVLWSSENAYEKTYNIKTASLDYLTTFTVTDIRLEGETKFQSELTNSTDLGNNELHIYKMDEDAYTLNVIENTFDYIKFNFNVKDEYKDIISNIRVDGLEMDEELGYWMYTTEKEIEITYDYYAEELGMLHRSETRTIGPCKIVLTTQNNGHAVMSWGAYLNDDFYNLLDDQLSVSDLYAEMKNAPNCFFNMKIYDGLGNIVIPDIYTIIPNPYDNNNVYYFEYIHRSDYSFNGKEHHAYFYHSLLLEMGEYSDEFHDVHYGHDIEDFDSLFRFRVCGNVYIFKGTWWKQQYGNEITDIILVEE